MVGRLSWQVVEDEPEDLHVVLFVRDSLRLSPQAVGQPGPLEPNVPDLRETTSRSQRDTASAAWPVWWASALGVREMTGPRLPVDASDAAFVRRARPVDPPGFESLAHAPELRDAARATWDAFREWWSPPWQETPARLSAKVRSDSRGSRENSSICICSDLSSTRWSRGSSVNSAGRQGPSSGGWTSSPSVNRRSSLSATTTPRSPVHCWPPSPSTGTGYTAAFAGSPDPCLEEIRSALIAADDL